MPYDAYSTYNNVLARKNETLLCANIILKIVNTFGNLNGKCLSLGGKGEKW